MGEEVDPMHEPAQELDLEEMFPQHCRVEWRKQGQTLTGTVVEHHAGGLTILADVPIGEPCPILWGPYGIFTKVE